MGKSTHPLVTETATEDCLYMLRITVLGRKLVEHRQ